MTETEIVAEHASSDDIPWTLEIDATSLDIDTKGSVTIALHVVGADQDPFMYNYVWNYENLWEEGFWDSTVNSTGGEYTTESVWEFQPKWAGSYHLFVTAVDPDDNKREIEMLLEVRFSSHPPRRRRPPCPRPRAKRGRGTIPQSRPGREARFGACSQPCSSFRAGGPAFVIS